MPTQIRDNGFFSDEAKSISAEIKTKYKQLFFYLTEVNEQTHKYLDRLEVPEQDLKQILTAALLARALTAYQALIFLAERGFASEVRVTCRSLLEAKFKLGYLVEEPKAADLMLANHEKERIKRLTKYKKGELPVHEDSADQDWDRLIADAKARQKNLIGKEGGLPHISTIAEKAGFSEDYAGPYSFFSDATHSGVRELDIYLEFNADNSAATGFRYGPNDGPWIPWCTLMATKHLRDCLEISAIIFEIRQERWFNSWLKTRAKRHQEMLDRYRDQLSADFKAGNR
jgi:hypothetical protein